MVNTKRRTERTASEGDKGLSPVVTVVGVWASFRLKELDSSDQKSPGALCGGGEVTPW